MPEDPEYTLASKSGREGRAYVHGVEYEGLTIEAGRSSHNIPCVVCSVSARNSVITITEKSSCPSGWTGEYEGFLMSGNGESSGAMYSCVDMSMAFIPGSQSDEPGGQFWHVEAGCEWNALLMTAKKNLGV